MDRPDRCDVRNGHVFVELVHRGALNRRSSPANNLVYVAKKGQQVNCFCKLMFVATSVVALPVDSAWADTILPFESASGFSLSDFSTYGDRITSPTQGGLPYGGAANTPRIVIDFGPSTFGWYSNYGDLSSVIYTAASDGVLRVTLTADPGYMVSLNSFDLAGWSQTDHVTKSVKIFDSLGHSLFSQSNVLVQGDNVGPRHTAFSFTSLTSQIINIQIDASNITDAFGAETVGLDNLRFTQVPEPGSLTLAAAGAVAIGMLLRKRRPRCTP
jgi:hypothetical protein